MIKCQILSEIMLFWANSLRSQLPTKSEQTGVSYTIEHSALSKHFPYHIYKHKIPSSYGFCINSLFTENRFKNLYGVKNHCWLFLIFLVWMKTWMCHAWIELWIDKLRLSEMSSLLGTMNFFFVGKKQHRYSVKLLQVRFGSQSFLLVFSI